MILKLQIALTILACLFTTAVIPVAAWTSLGWGVILGLCALLCYGGMLLCKQKTQANEPQEQTDNEDQPLPAVEDQSECTEKEDENTQK
jgi:hypothetical protein